VTVPYEKNPWCSVDTHRASRRCDCATEVTVDPVPSAVDWDDIYYVVFLPNAALFIFIYLRSTIFELPASFNLILELIVTNKLL
jgi:hypothetical protein